MSGGNRSSLPRTFLETVTVVLLHHHDDDGRDTETRSSNERDQTSNKHIFDLCDCGWTISETLPVVSQRVSGSNSSRSSNSSSRSAAITKLPSPTPGKLSQNLKGSLRLSRCVLPTPVDKNTTPLHPSHRVSDNGTSVALGGEGSRDGGRRRRTFGRD